MLLQKSYNHEENGMQRSVFVFDASNNTDRVAHAKTCKTFSNIQVSDQNLIVLFPVPLSVWWIQASDFSIRQLHTLKSGKQLYDRKGCKILIPYYALAANCIAADSLCIPAIKIQWATYDIIIK